MMFLLFHKVNQFSSQVNLSFVFTNLKRCQVQNSSDKCLKPFQRKELELKIDLFVGALIHLATIYFW